MLILKRRLQEAIMIGDDIKVTVQRFSDNQVRIGVDAPKDCKILREEIRENDSSNEEI